MRQPLTTQQILRELTATWSRLPLLLLEDGKAVRRDRGRRLARAKGLVAGPAPLDVIVSVAFQPIDADRDDRGDPHRRCAAARHRGSGRRLHPWSTLARHRF